MEGSTESRPTHRRASLSMPGSARIQSDLARSEETWISKSKTGRLLSGPPSEVLDYQRAILHPPGYFVRKCPVWMALNIQRCLPAEMENQRFGDRLRKSVKNLHFGRDCSGSLRIGRDYSISPVIRIQLSVSCQRTQRHGRAASP